MTMPQTLVSWPTNYLLKQEIQTYPPTEHRYSLPALAQLSSQCDFQVFRVRVNIITAFVCCYSLAMVNHRIPLFVYMVLDFWDFLCLSNLLNKRLIMRSYDMFTLLHFIHG